MAHNWVHFFFPTTVATYAPKVAKPNAVLTDLLTPHRRFTEQLNYEVRVFGSLENIIPYFFLRGLEILDFSTIYSSLILA